MRLLNLGARAIAWSAPALALTLSLAAPAFSQDASGQQPAAAEAGLSERVVASVNDDIISTYDLEQRVRLLSVLSGTQVTADNAQQFQRQALQYLVEDHLKLQELRHEETEQKFTIIATDADIDDEIAGTAKSNNMTSAQLMAALAQQGVAPETYRTQLRAEISWQRWIRGRYGSRLRIGEDQIKAYQDRISAESGKPRYSVSEVFIDAQRSGGMQQAMDEANQLVSQLHNGAPFQAVAKQFSADATAANGGDAGWVTPAELPAEVVSTLDGMRAGALSAPIQTRDGVWIVLLHDKQAAGGALMISLKQAALAVPADATPDQVEAAKARLEALRPQLHGCDDFETIAGKVDGVQAGDLGEADAKDLAPAFHDAAIALPVGQVSEPLRSDQGWHLIAVCGKRASGGAKSLTHDQIEDQLIGAQLQMIDKRYLRDLVNSASIEVH